MGTLMIHSFLQIGKLRHRKAEQLAGGHITTRQPGAHHLVPHFSRQGLWSLESQAWPRAAITVPWPHAALPDGLNFQEGPGMHIVL